MKSLLWKLLRKNVSATQLAGFAIANFVGLAIVATAIQFYADVSPVFADSDNFLNRDYVIITKRVGTLSSITGSRPAFSDADIAEIEHQPWTTSVGRFTASRFRVFASLGQGHSALSSQMFFESIPDKYIDVIPDNWQFSPDNPDIPVIISKDYLSLYNFGFASSQGMPQLSEAMIGMVPINFTITGAGRSITLKGHIAGFSNRLNTIIVPDKFMKWANANFGDSATTDDGTARLIVEVNSPGDAQIADYMAFKGYEIAGEQSNASQASHFLTVITSIVLIIGAVISVLAFFILLLSIHLLLQKNAETIRNLLSLGYSPRAVAMPYVGIVAITNSAILLCAIVAMMVARSYYSPLIAAFGTEGSPLIGAIAISATIMALISAGNIIAISRTVRNLNHA